LLEQLKLKLYFLRTRQNYIKYMSKNARGDPKETAVRQAGVK